MKIENKEFYTSQEIQEEFNLISSKAQVRILWNALEHMQRYNGRSTFHCMAMAMGYDNYEGEKNTYFKM